MAKRYTAQEMRSYADAIAGDLRDNDHGGVEYFYDDLIPVIESLRQAADAMEREKKYEYKVLYCMHDGRVSDSITHTEDIQTAMDSLKVYSGHDDAHIVRRSVGEWEEVK